MKALLEVLEERLAVNIQLLSSFDKYKREVLGGNLDWGPMHTSDQFWRDNTSKLEEKDFQIIRVLLKLLETSRDVSPSKEFRNLLVQHLQALALSSTISSMLRLAYDVLPRNDAISCIWCQKPANMGTQCPAGQHPCCGLQ